MSNALKKTKTKNKRNKQTNKNHVQGLRRAKVDSLRKSEKTPKWKRMAVSGILLVHPWSHDSSETYDGD